MVTCTFFGHRDCPASIKPKLRETLVDLIDTQGAELFYVGNQGAFDRMVRAVLRELAQQYPNIRYAVVLERVPPERDEYHTEDDSDTMLPEGVEKAPQRFAIAWRNQWMLRQADLVVTYVIYSWGGAARFAEQAERQGKTVINLAKALSDDHCAAVETAVNEKNITEKG